MTGERSSRPSSPAPFEEGADSTTGLHRVVVALGSNLGDRRAHLRAAVDALAPVASSQVWETEPVGGPEGQGAFLNMVVVVHTPLGPSDFLRLCQRIEADAGRERTVHWGPRTLDVDIVFFDDLVIDTPDLIVPHPRAFERRFVLEPLAEVDPERCPADWRTRAPAAEVVPRGQL